MPEDYPDRRVGLVVFGAIDILFGIFCFALAMLMLVVVSATGLGGMKPVHFNMALGFFFALTVWFVWMGMGTLKGRRWARALMLVGSWVAVFFGTMLLAVVLFVLPELYNRMSDIPALAPPTALAILYAIVFLLALLQIVFPVVCIAFYGSKGVQATCERLNPAPCWTDRTSQPLLAMSFIAIAGSSLVVVAASTNYIAFVFGHVVDGWRGALVAVFVSAACGYIGWGAYKRKMHAWWGAYALVVLISSSMMLTVSEMDMPELYAHMRYTPEQVAQLQEIYPVSPSTLIFLSCAWGIMACIYLVWVRDSFRTEKNPERVISYQRRKADEESLKPRREESRARMRLD